MLAIRLDQELEERLNRLAKKTGRTKTFYAREAILRHLADLEKDYYTATVEEPSAAYAGSGKPAQTQLEKLRQMETLWAELTADPDSFESPAWHEDVLQQRDADLAAGKDEFIPWEDAKRELQARRSK